MTQARKRLFVAGAIVLAFLVGFGWQYIRADRLEGRLERTERELEFMRLEATLAAATIQAQQGAWESARRLTSDFYTGLRPNRASAPAEQAEEVEAILAQRDQLITLLSRGDPAARDRLLSTYRRFRIVVGGPERALPVDATDTPAVAPAGG